MTASWIRKLNLSDSRLHKEDVLRQAYEASVLGSENARVFLNLLKECYDPYIVYGVKQIADTEDLYNRENPWNDFHDLLVKLSIRELTGNDARAAIEHMSIRFDSEEWNNFCAPIIRRDIRAGISEKTINKITKGTEYEIPIFGCQLATNSEGRPEMRGKKRLEPKLDGVRVLMNVLPFKDDIGLICYSRNGKIFENFKHIELQIKDIYNHFISKFSNVLAGGFILDGEVVGNSFQELMRQARRKENVQSHDSVFYIFDIIPIHDFYSGRCTIPLHRRVEMLQQNREIIEETKNVKLLSHIIVDLDTNEGRDVLVRYANDQVANGYEGVMIKDINSPYECSRNKHWLKWKPVNDYDLCVVDVEEGTGKNSGKMGNLICEGIDDGKHIRVSVGSGFTDDERHEYWQNKINIIGKTVTVIADCVTQNMDNSYSLRFPRFKCFRYDK